MFSWRRKAPRERRRRKHLGGSGGMLPQEIFKIEYSETPFTVVKKIANIDLKVPDVEWQTTGRNVRPPASNETLQTAAYCHHQAHSFHSK